MCDCLTKFEMQMQGKYPDFRFQKEWVVIKDEGFKRLGCIGCPMAGKALRLAEFARWPKYKVLYLRAFERMLSAREAAGMQTDWKTPDEVMDWWINGKAKTKTDRQN